MKRVNPLVTIGIAVKNGEKFLRYALDSALNQDYEKFEVLCFNDGSSDSTEEIVRGFKDTRLSLISSTRNFGLGYGRQLLKTMAKGDYITWLDADDIYSKNRLSILVEYAVSKGIDIACDTYRFMSHDGELLDEYYSAPSHVASDLYFTRNFERNFVIPHPLISRRCYQSINYDLSLTSSNDYDFWLKASFAGFTFSQLKDVLLFYRLSQDSLGSNISVSRAETRIILGKFKVEDIIKLYKTRGFKEEIINYMACLQHIYRGNYDISLEYAKKPWIEEEGADRNFYLGTLLLRLGDVNKAEKYIDLHLERDPASPAGLNNMGLVKRKLGKDGDELFSRSIQLFPEYLDARHNLEDSRNFFVTDTYLKFGKSR